MESSQFCLVDAKVSWVRAVAPFLQRTQGWGTQMLRD